MGIVPYEFRGMARVFRAAMYAEDIAYDRAFHRLTAPIGSRLKRKPTLRPAMITDITREWRRMPGSQYRLRPIAIQHDDDGRHLEIVEQRVAAGRIVDPQWASPELGLMITELGIKVSGGRLATWMHARTAVSGHAVGRRFERVRAADRCAEAVLADVGELVGRTDNVLGWKGIDFLADDSGQPREMRDIRTWLWMD